MQKKNTKLDFSGQDIYVGLDTGKKSWRVTILTGESEHRTFTQPPKPKALVGYLHKHFPGARYLCVYEAGYFGFWIHDALRQQGVECIVTHPADVPTKDKERRNRTIRWMPGSWLAICAMENCLPCMFPLERRWKIGL